MPSARSSSISRRTSRVVLRIFCVAFHARLEILVEARDGNDADAHFPVAALQRMHFLLRCLRFERDLRALERTADSPLRRARRRQGESAAGPPYPAGPADQLHDVVEAPSDHVGQRARLALADRGDAVADLDLGRGRRGAARQHVHDRHVVVDELQRGADALVRQAHRDVVFLGIPRRQVVRMRIVDVRVRVHESLEHVVGRDLLDALRDALIALAQRCRWPRARSCRRAPAIARRSSRACATAPAVPPCDDGQPSSVRSNRKLFVEREIGLDVE